MNQSLGLAGLKNKSQTISNEEEVEDGSVTAKKRPQSKKWKHLARDICAKDESKLGLLAKKRPIREAGKQCPEAKKLKMSSLMEMVAAMNGMFSLATLSASANSKA